MRRSGPRAGDATACRCLAAGGDGLALAHQRLRLADRGDVDHAPVEGDGAEPLRLGLGHGRHDAPGLVQLLRAGAEDVVDEVDLAGMDDPLALEAEDGGAHGRGPAAGVVAEVRVGAVDGPEPMRAGGDRETGQGVVPHVVPVLAAAPLGIGVGQHRVARMRAADGHGPGAGRGGEVAGPEVERLQPVAGAGDGVDVLHAERGLDQHLDAEPLLAAHRRLDLGEEHVDGVDVGGGARPWAP